MARKSVSTLLHQPMTKNPTQVDQHVGSNLRKMRLLVGATQEDLAKILELSYQQIQKYETGANRISAGRLWQMSELFDCAPNNFFEGFDAANPINTLEHGGKDRQTLELVKNFMSVKNPELKTALCGLMRSLVT